MNNTTERRAGSQTGQKTSLSEFTELSGPKHEVSHTTETFIHSRNQTHRWSHISI